MIWEIHPEGVCSYSPITSTQSKRAVFHLPEKQPCFVVTVMLQILDL